MHFIKNINLPVLSPVVNDDSSVTFPRFRPMRLVTLVIHDIRLILQHLRGEGLRDTARWLHSRDAPGFAQFIKYGICGLGATIIHNGLFVLFLIVCFPLLGMDATNDAAREKNAILANLLAWPFSNLFAYFANSMWVFTTGRHSKWFEFGMFTFISLLGLLGGILGGPILISEGVPEWLAQIGFIFTSFAVNYVCRKTFIFLK